VSVAFHTTPNCRSRLAGDGGRMNDARLKGLIANKLAPTGIVDVRSLSHDTKL